MTIGTLENYSAAEIALLFNEAFEDYKIKLQFNEKTMAQKIKAENISLKYSPVVYVDNRAVAFILNATGFVDTIPTIYNGGTGVVAAYRGRRLVRKMYDYIVPALAKAGYMQHYLEVFDDNHKAINAYRNCGFTISRNMQCYRGKINNTDTGRYSIETINLMPEKFQLFWDVKPTWQNSLTAIERVPSENNIIGISRDNEVVAYAIYNQVTGRLKQLAVDKNFRRRGAATSLLNYISNTSASNDITITNVEHNDAIQQFLASRNFSVFTGMLEMKYQ